MTGKFTTRKTGRSAAAPGDRPGSVGRPSAGPPRRVVAALVAGLVSCGALAFLAGPHLAEALDMLLDLRRLAQDEMAGGVRIFIVLALYACLIAIPFVPGAELGLLLLLLFGAPLAGPVYAATVAGLLLSFTVGRLTPRPLLRRFLTRLSLERVLDAADRLAAAPGAPATGDATHGRLLGRLLQWRCCVLVVMINTPGNTVLGGGGGISMAAGLSGLFSFRAFLASVLIAVAPVPAFVLLAALWA